MRPSMLLLQLQAALMTRPGPYYAGRGPDPTTQDPVRTSHLRLQPCLVGDGPGDPCCVAVFPISGVCWCYRPFQLHL